MFCRFLMGKNPLGKKFCRTATCSYTIKLNCTISHYNCHISSNLCFFRYQKSQENVASGNSITLFCVSFVHNITFYFVIFSRDSHCTQVSHSSLDVAAPSPPQGKMEVREGRVLLHIGQSCSNNSQLLHTYSYLLTEEKSN